MDIRAFSAVDLGDAADLFCSHYATQHTSIPELPSAWKEPARVAPLLERIVAAGPALVARDGEELRGYLAGWTVGTGREPWVYVPEWAHGARGPERRRTWEALYQALLPEWLRRGTHLHRITLLEGDRELADALGWLSFGTMMVDAIRGTDAVGSASYAVRRATAADSDIVVGLREGLRRHLQSTPVYLVLPDPIDPAVERAKLVDPAIATLLAEVGGEVVGFLRIGPASEDVATIVQDPGTASISGAFTLGDRRGAGIGSCLLDRGLAWARESGFVRVAVDFEAMNLLAARFWTANFRPVAVTMSRDIDPRAVAAVPEFPPPSA